MRSILYKFTVCIYIPVRRSGTYTSVMLVKCVTFCLRKEQFVMLNGGILISINGNLSPRPGPLVLIQARPVLFTITNFQARSAVSEYLIDKHFNKF